MPTAFHFVTTFKAGHFICVKAGYLHSTLLRECSFTHFPGWICSMRRDHANRAITCKEHHTPAFSFLRIRGFQLAAFRVLRTFTQIGLTVFFAVSMSSRHLSGFSDFIFSHLFPSLLTSLWLRECSLPFTPAPRVAEHKGMLLASQSTKACSSRRAFLILGLRI